MKTIARISSIGYQGRSVNDLCTDLATAKVKLLIDVRAIAWSQRPEYRKTAFSNALQTHGVDYMHCKVAGNPFRNSDDWKECRRLYTQYLSKNPHIVLELMEAISSHNAALFCYESERTSCHRGILMQFLRKKCSKILFIDL